MPKLRLQLFQKSIFPLMKRGTLLRERGSSLMEVLVAISLLSLATLTTSLLFTSSKILERRTLWHAAALSRAFSIAESGYLSKNYQIAYWHAELQKSFPGCDIRLESRTANGQSVNPSSIFSVERKLNLIFSPKKESTLPVYKFEL